MIKLMEKYDLRQLYKAIKEDIHHQHPDLSQHKNIAQQTITELMIDNLKKKQKKHD